MKIDIDLEQACLGMNSSEIAEFFRELALIELDKEQRVGMQVAQEWRANIVSHMHHEERCFIVELAELIKQEMPK